VLHRAAQSHFKYPLQANDGQQWSGHYKYKIALCTNTSNACVSMEGPSATHLHRRTRTVPRSMHMTET
jgi:hypothetical protein